MKMYEYFDQMSKRAYTDGKITWNTGRPITFNWILRRKIMLFITRYSFDFLDFKITLNICIIIKLTFSIDVLVRLQIRIGHMIPISILRGIYILLVIHES